MADCLKPRAQARHNLRPIARQGLRYVFISATLPGPLRIDLRIGLISFHERFLERLSRGQIDRRQIGDRHNTRHEPCEAVSLSSGTWRASGSDVTHNLPRRSQWPLIPQAPDGLPKPDPAGSAARTSKSGRAT